MVVGKLLLNVLHIFNKNILLVRKTSLLRCVVGIRAPSSGRISVFGHTPGTPQSGIPGPGLGYTPQVSFNKMILLNIF